jgi:hypothetical protein
MNKQPILNKNSPWIHTKLEFGVLGVAKKLVKYVVQLFKKKKSSMPSPKLAFSVKT